MAYTQHVADAQGIVARCAVITLSDTRTPDTDTSGATIRRLLDGEGHTVAAYEVMPDDPDHLRLRLKQLLDDQTIDVLLTNGGTGISPRDKTIDVIESALDVVLPGFGEIFRMMSCSQIGSGAMLSRAIGGIARGKPLFAMPGSTKAVELAMTELILPELRHILHELRKQRRDPPNLD